MDVRADVLAGSAGAAHVRQAPEDAYGTLPPTHAPDVTEAAGGSTRLSFPADVDLGFCLTVATVLGCSRGLSPDAVEGAASFTTADGRLAVDPMRPLAAAYARPDLWDAGDLAPRDLGPGDTWDVRGFAEAQLPHDDPEEGTRVRFWPVGAADASEGAVGRVEDERGRRYVYRAGSFAAGRRPTWVHCATLRSRAVDEPARAGSVDGRHEGPTEAAREVRAGRGVRALV